MRGTASARVFPKAREERLVVEELSDEVLIYDLDRDEAHCLNATAALVWKHCDGRRSVASLAGLLSADSDGASGEEIVWRALEQLSTKRLLAEPLVRHVGGPDWSRRELLVRIGGVGAAAAAAPLVTSIVAPAYGQTVSLPGSALSHVSALFVCDAGTANEKTYRMKWDADAPAVPEECPSPLTENCPGGGDGTLARTDTGTNYTVEQGCLAGTSILEDVDGDVTFSYPLNCRLDDYILKCKDVCLGPTTADALPDTISPHTTAQKCTAM